MAKVVVLGVAGDADLWVADLDAGTVTRLAQPASGALKAAADLRAAGAAVVKGVDFAVAVASGTSAAAGHLDG